MDDKSEAKKISYDYIRGLVEGEGCFTFSTSNQKLANGEVIRRKIPAFAIAMHERDEELLRLIRNTLKLPNRIYKYKNDKKDGYKRGKITILIVREIGAIRTIIVPLFYKRLIGNKGRQFDAWMEKIGSDPEIPPKFKSVYHLYKTGFYDKYPKY